MHPGRPPSERSLDPFGTKSVFLYSVESSVPAVSSFNTSNNDFFTAVTEQQMIQDEPHAHQRQTIRPSLPEEHSSMNSTLPSSTLITPLELNQGPEYAYPASASANDHLATASGTSVHKLSGWTDQSVQYPGPNQSVQYMDLPLEAPTSNQWVNPYP